MVVGVEISHGLQYKREEKETFLGVALVLDLKRATTVETGGDLEEEGRDLKKR